MVGSSVKLNVSLSIIYCAIELYMIELSIVNKFFIIFTVFMVWCCITQRLLFGSVIKSLEISSSEIATLSDLLTANTNNSADWSLW